MFWTSLLAGLTVLLSWKIWVALFLYVFLSILTLALVGTLGKTAESGSGGCLFMIFMLAGRSLLQGIFVSFFVAVMLPVMLGSPNITPMSDVIALSWLITKAGILATVFVICLCIIPIVGSLIADSTGIQTFVMGAIISRFFLAQVEQNVVMGEQSIYPSLLACVGYLVISAVLVWLLTMLGAMVSSLLGESVATGMAVSVGPVLGILGGFLPLFMYVKYVELSVRAGAGQ